MEQTFVAATATKSIAIAPSMSVSSLQEQGPREAGLRSLAGSDLAPRFHRWVGASARRFVTSVFPVDETRPDAGLPDYDGCIVLLVCRHGLYRSAVEVAALARHADRRRLVARARTLRADEWHVHCPTGEADRRAALADLGALHAARVISA